MEGCAVLLLVLSVAAREQLWDGGGCEVWRIHLLWGTGGLVFCPAPLEHSAAFITERSWALRLLPVEGPKSLTAGERGVFPRGQQQPGLCGARGFGTKQLSLELAQSGLSAGQLGCHSAAGVIGGCSFGGNCGFGCCGAHPW